MLETSTSFAVILLVILGVFMIKEHSATEMFFKEANFPNSLLLELVLAIDKTRRQHRKI
jgi:hypothetical protein